MAFYRITGAARSSGADVAFTVSADSKSAAEAIAHERGVLVSSIEPVILSSKGRTFRRIVVVAGVLLLVALAVLIIQSVSRPTYLLTQFQAGGTRPENYRDLISSAASSVTLDLGLYGMQVQTALIQLERGVKDASTVTAGPRFVDQIAIELNAVLNGEDHSSWLTTSLHQDERSVLFQHREDLMKLITSVTSGRMTSSIYGPEFGFISGCVARIGANDRGQSVLVINELATTTEFNTLRASEKERAARVIQDYIFANLDHIYRCSFAMKADYVAVVVGYSSRDFSDALARRNAEAVAVIASMTDCSAFLARDLSQEEFLRRCEVHLRDVNGSLKVVELELR